MRKRAFITGFAGQDGSYLAEYLLEKDYDVYGLVRHSTTTTERKNIKHLLSSVEICEGDVTDAVSLSKTISAIRPHEVYNLAAQSHVGTSFQIPAITANATGIGALNVLESVRNLNFRSKVYQASTSELFGNTKRDGQTLNEESPFDPTSPYAVSKMFAHYMMKTYRNAYNIFACCGILFNHESPRRGYDFVTQKVCRGVASIKLGKTKVLSLGNLDAARDWGHASDYVRGMHMMMQHHTPGDYVLATGKSRTIRELVKIAFDDQSLNPDDHVVIDASNKRPSDVDVLTGDASLAKHDLGWEPLISFEEMIHEMISHSLVELESK